MDNQGTRGTRGGRGGRGGFMPKKGVIVSASSSNASSLGQQPQQEGDSESGQSSSKQVVVVPKPVISKTQPPPKRTIPLRSPIHRHSAQVSASSDVSSAAADEAKRRDVVMPISNIKLDRSDSDEGDIEKVSFNSGESSSPASNGDDFEYGEHGAVVDEQDEPKQEEPATTTAEKQSTIAEKETAATEEKGVYNDKESCHEEDKDDAMDGSH